MYGQTKIVTRRQYHPVPHTNPFRHPLLESILSLFLKIYISIYSFAAWALAVCLQPLISRELASPLRQLCLSLAED